MSALILAVGSPGAVEAAPARDSTDRAQIRAFVDRIHSRWGVTINSDDYEVAAVDGVDVIKPKGAPVSVKANSDGAGNGDFTMSTPVAAPPPPAPGAMTAQAETDWHQPTCYARLNALPHPGIIPDEMQPYMAWMDTCSQWGEMNYAGATRRNVAFKMYASCGLYEDHPSKTKLVSCYVDSERHPDSDPLYWNDWSPKSTEVLPDCSDVILTIGYEGVEASYVVHTCEEFIPDKGAEPADFRATWRGEAFSPSDVRETGMLIGIGHDWDAEYVALSLEWGFRWEFCSLFDSCE